MLVTIVLTNARISGVVLEKICEYFLYNERNKGQENVPDMDIPPELCLELLMAADYLDSEYILQLRSGLFIPCSVALMCFVLGKTRMHRS